MHVQKCNANDGHVAYYSFTEIIDNCHGDINVYYNYNTLKWCHA